MLASELAVCRLRVDECLLYRVGLLAPVTGGWWRWRSGVALCGKLLALRASSGAVSVCVCPCMCVRVCTITVLGYEAGTRLGTFLRSQGVS